MWEVGCDLHKWQWSWKDKVLLSLHLYRKLWFHLVFSIWRDFGLPNLYIKIFLAMDEKQQKKVGVQTWFLCFVSPHRTLFDSWEALAIYRHLLLLHTHLNGWGLFSSLRGIQLKFWTNQNHSTRKFMFIIVPLFWFLFFLSWKKNNDLMQRKINSYFHLGRKWYSFLLDLSLYI